MAYEGFLSFGGNEVINSPRAEGITRSADCAVNSIVGESCPTLADALGHAPYAFWNIQDAPWYDPDLPELSSKVYGVYGLGLTGLQDSTRETTVTEGLADGGVIGMTRRAVREIRARFQVFAKGQEAADYAMGWLDAALSPDACGQHGTDCGTTDVEFLAECPPERATVRDYGEWSETARNLFSNPSFEAGPWPMAVRTNLFTNPAVASTAGFSTVAGQATMTYTGSAVRWEALTNSWTEMRLDGSGVATGAPARLLVRARASKALTARMRIRDGAGADAFLTTDWQWFETTGAAGTGSAAQTGLYFPTPHTHAAGDWVEIDRVLIALGADTGPWFSGSAQPRVRENIFRNPSAVSTSRFEGGSGQTTVSHTGAAVRWDIVTTQAVNIGMNAGNLPSTPHRILVRARANRNLAARLRVRAGQGPDLTLTPEWQWFEATLSGTGNANQTGLILLGDAGHVPGDWVEVDRVLVAVDGDEGEWFGGSAGAPEGFATAWTGTPDDSPSFMYDADFSVFWTGAENASESLLTGMPVAGVRANECVAIRSAKFGGSMRLIPITTSNNTYAEAHPYPGHIGQQTLLGTLHLEAPITGTLNSRALRITSGIPIVSSGAAPNVAGSYERRLTTASGTPTANGRILFEHGGAQGSGDVYWTMGGLFEGVYTGPWFSGSSVPAEHDEHNEPLVRYSWAGAANASDSIQESRTFTDRTQNDIEYAATVDGLRRYLHDAAVTSGPTIVSERVRDGIVYRVVEFTISVGRPWTFGKTKPVELPVTPQAIVEDIHYNLVPHPSMELPSGATSVVARNFNPNPSVETDTTGWGASATTVSGDSVTPYRTSARSTDIAAVGAASFLVRVLGDGSTAAGGRSVLEARTPLASISALSSTTRMSFSTWAALMSIIGSGNVLHSLTANVKWYGPLVLIGSVPLEADGDLNGMIFTGKGLQIPSGATRVQIEVAGEVTWASSATPSQNSDIRLYVDAAAYMVP